MAAKKHKQGKGDHPEEETPPQSVEVMDGAEEPAEPPAAEPSDAEPADELARLRSEVTEWKDKFLRAKAEQQNAARRAANELAESLRYATSGVLGALLEVVDDFDRTLEAAPQSDTVESVIDGIRLVRDKLEKLLRDHHVEVIDAEGAVFDPSRHQALMRQPSADHEPGTVVQQVQKGYVLRERVLRPAKVIVATAPAEDTDASEEPRDAAEGES